jgi:hypothetical protein
MPREPNPEAIAWYLQRSEALLDDHRERVESLRRRGGQLAGFSGAVLALVGADASSILAVLDGAARTLAGVALLAGAFLLIVASVTALRGAMSPQVLSDLSVEEVANYAADRFVEEPDLWRVHLRTIRALILSIEFATRLGDRAARAVAAAERFFFIGMSLVGIALGIIIVTEML